MALNIPPDAPKEVDPGAKSGGAGSKPSVVAARAGTRNALFTHLKWKNVAPLQAGTTQTMSSRNAFHALRETIDSSNGAQIIVIEGDDPDEIRRLLQQISDASKGHGIFVRSIDMGALERSLGVHPSRGIDEAFADSTIKAFSNFRVISKITTSLTILDAVDERYKEKAHLIDFLGRSGWLMRKWGEDARHVYIFAVDLNNKNLSRTGRDMYGTATIKLAT